MPDCGAKIVRNLPSAGVAELVDALDLESSGESRGGSSPSARTTRPNETKFAGPPVFRHDQRVSSIASLCGVSAETKSECDASY